MGDAARAKRLDDKHEQILRDLLKLNGNKKCFDCSQKGPLYVCLDYNTFVCSACSGVHREFGHRVKSVSMASFKPEEIERIKKGGNDIARQIFLARYEARHFPEPDAGDTPRIREFMRLKYIEKRWYSPPRYEEPQKQQQVESYIPKPEPLSNILGSDIPAISVGGFTTSFPPTTATAAAAPQTSAPTPAPVPTPTPAPTPVPPKTDAKTDLLGLFDTPTVQPQQQQQNFWGAPQPLPQSTNPWGFSTQPQVPMMAPPSTLFQQQQQQQQPVPMLQSQPTTTQPVQSPFFGAQAPVTQTSQPTQSPFFGGGGGGVGTAGGTTTAALQLQQQQQQILLQQQQLQHQQQMMLMMQQQQQQQQIPGGGAPMMMMMQQPTQPMMYTAPGGYVMQQPQAPVSPFFQPPPSQSTVAGSSATTQKPDAFAEFDVLGSAKKAREQQQSSLLGGGGGGGGFAPLGSSTTPRTSSTIPPSTTVLQPQQQQQQGFPFF